jgi:hypothetical protein
MGLNRVAMTLIVFACLAFQAAAQDSSIPSSDDIKSTFHNEDLFKISSKTGMAPGTGKDVRTPVAVVPIANVAGSWSLTLRGTQERIMNLTLGQSGDAVFGQGGVLITQGMMPAYETVSVAGTAVGSQLYLFVTPVSGQGLYRINVMVNSGSMSGNYLYSGQGVEQPGVVFGKLVAAEASSFVPQGSSIVPVPTTKKDTMPLGPKNEIPY